MPTDTDTTVQMEQQVAVLETALRTIASQYQPAVLATAFGPESMVMIDLIARHELDIEVVSIDTGRLPEATQALVQSVRRRYGLAIRLVAPDAHELEAWIGAHGPNGFYESPALRESCCGVRKVRPLHRALVGKRAWITGVRRDQTAHRQLMSAEQWDPTRQLHKFNPMLDWTSDAVWSYIKQHQVPYNTLHDKGYPSIGCAPCTRATALGEDARAGR